MKVEGCRDGYGIIHEEYAERVNEKQCFRRHEIPEEHWRKMTSAEELKWWGATNIQKETTALGVGVVKHTRYRWGDNLKVIDRFKVVKAGTEYKEVDKKIEEVENGAA